MFLFEGFSVCWNLWTSYCHCSLSSTVIPSSFPQMAERNSSASFLFGSSETEFHYVAYAGHKCAIFLPQLPGCQNCRHESPCQQTQLRSVLLSPDISFVPSKDICDVYYCHTESYLSPPFIKSHFDSYDVPLSCVRNTSDKMSLFSYCSLSLEDLC